MGWHPSLTHSDTRTNLSHTHTHTRAHLYASQHGMASVASLNESMRERTRSFFMPAGGASMLRGTGLAPCERLSKRHCPILPGVNLPAGQHKQKVRRGSHSCT